MKHLVALLTGLISFSCQNQANQSDRKDQEVATQLTENENTKVQLNGIDNHPNKEYMEWFLNNYEEEFIAYELDWDTLEYDSLIQKSYSFHTKLSNVSVMLIFCENQEYALSVADANFHDSDSTHQYGVNGGVLFIVQGDDQYEVDGVLSWFAGGE